MPAVSCHHFFNSAPQALVPSYVAFESDDDDEWGILHYPTQKYRQYSRFEMETTYRGVEVSLVIVVALSPNVSSHLQQTRATWIFNASKSYSLEAFCVNQEPMFRVGFLTSSHFNAYVSDRMEFAARRYLEWTTGSRLGRTPRHALSTSTKYSSNATRCAAIATKLQLKIRNRNTKRRPAKVMLSMCTAPKKSLKSVTMPWVHSASIDPRYMVYVQTLGESNAPSCVAIVKESAPSSPDTI
ncbi:hypothetical protein PsorP6_012953 [Peronosclerospora sorghi]|uniref:Uncharacterized protein n=1 Tax=Peronosclerospora sorghi TaxID=230839 RepID=A0ACC0WFS8_9STRA|nr:hypothetical protein PsorP6_012953 [Peronosclerospora sorghi]